MLYCTEIVARYSTEKKSEIFCFAKCEIFAPLRWNHSLRSWWNEIHLLAVRRISLSEGQFHRRLRRFHPPDRVDFVEKSQVENRLGFFLGRGGRTRTRDPRFWSCSKCQPSLEIAHFFARFNALFKNKSNFFRQSSSLFIAPQILRSIKSTLAANM